MSDDVTTDVRTLLVSPWPVVRLWVAATGALLVAWPLLQDAVLALAPGGDPARWADPGEWAARLVLWVLLGGVPPWWAVGRHGFGHSRLVLASDHLHAEQVGLLDPVRLYWLDVGPFVLGGGSSLRARLLATSARATYAPPGLDAVEVRVPVTVRGLSRAAVVDLLNAAREAARRSGHDVVG